LFVNCFEGINIATGQRAYTPDESTERFGQNQMEILSPGIDPAWVYGGQASHVVWFGLVWLGLAWFGLVCAIL
jgi:hypothetical protein